MKRDLLEQPFTTEQIKQRAGNFGQTLDYIEGHAVIKRLNDAFEGQWSFQVRSHDVLEAEVIVLGELIAGNISKSQFGSSSITRAKNSGDIISLADDLKAATTDSLKKCATMFGVGLHLYSNEKFPVTNAPPSRSQDVDYSSNNSGTNHSSTNPANTNQSGRISSKQHKYLLSISQDRGLSKQELNRKSIESYGSAVAYLSKQQASDMIASMLHN